MTKVRTRSVTRSEFDLRQRSGLYFGLKSKLLFCPRGRLVCAANLPECKPLRSILYTRHQAWQCLWKSQAIVFYLPSCRSRKLGNEANAYLGAWLQWRQESQEKWQLPWGLLNVHGGLIPLLCPPWMGPGSMKEDSSSVFHDHVVRWRTGRAGRSHRVSSSAAGLWGESGHLGSPGLGMPFAPKDWVEWAAPLAGSQKVVFVKMSQIPDSGPQGVTSGTG